MKKLKNKIFFTISIILTLVLCIFLIIFNVQRYQEAKNEIKNSLEQVNKRTNTSSSFTPTKEPDEEFSIDDNLKFIDSVLYTVLLDKYDNIKDIVNHSQNTITTAEISEVAQKILHQKKIKEKYIGCLYIADYSYAYHKGVALTILDNSIIKSKLRSYLQISLIIFIILEILIILLSKKLTEWIIEPVRISFDKQKQFIADASHELKTPLSVIVASSDALEENPKEKKWLTNIKNEADRMNLLISDLLELAESEDGVEQILEIGDLSKVVELSVLTFEGKTFEKNLTLEYKIEENIKFKMNENSIRQLIEILLDNAIQHSKEKGCIEVYLKQTNNDIILEVINQGEAIPSGEEEKIFERFYRVDKSRNRVENRYGLGLAIAKNITKNHNGKISASSNKGKTTFKVILKKA